jgi:hypothetical protein
MDKSKKEFKYQLLMPKKNTGWKAQGIEEVKRSASCKPSAVVASPAATKNQSLSPKPVRTPRSSRNKSP